MKGNHNSPINVINTMYINIDVQPKQNFQISKSVGQKIIQDISPPTDSDQYPSSNRSNHLESLASYFFQTA